MYTERRDNMAGGEGYATLKHILGPKEELNGKKCRLFAEITLNPGCSIGYHVHHNECETYYILTGKGEYNDNGTARIVEPGDMTFTPDGYGHGIKNVGEETLTFMALILLD